jgi:hypothetical protein
MDKAEKRWHQKSLKFAEAVIREKVDLEQLFDSKALYETTGDQLRAFLAYAYRCGQLSKTA